MKENFSAENKNINKNEKTLPFGRINQPLDDYFKENNIKAPPVEITIAFTRHVSASDAEFFEPYLENADIVIPEVVGWNQSSLTDFQKLSDKKLSPNDYTYKGEYGTDFLKKFEELLYNAPAKKVTFMDAEENSFLNRKQKKEAEQNWNDRLNILKEKIPFEEAADLTAKVIFEKGKTILPREKHMVETLPKAIGNIIRDNKNLTNKELLKVFIYLGATHTRIYHILYSRGEKVKRVFPDMPYDYQGTPHISRSGIFDKNIDKNKNYVEQEFFIDLCTGYPFFETHKILSDGEYQAYLNFLKKYFSHEIMKEIYESAVGEQGFNPDLFSKKVFMFLEKNNIPIIITEKDANKVRNFIVSNEK